MPPLICVLLFCHPAKQANLGACSPPNVEAILPNRHEVGLSVAVFEACRLQTEHLIEAAGKNFDQA